MVNKHSFLKKVSTHMFASVFGKVTPGAHKPPPPPPHRWYDKGGLKCTMKFYKYHRKLHRTHQNFINIISLKDGIYPAYLLS
jgi:hypothetical protein